jgi:hypothetical protein
MRSSDSTLIEVDVQRGACVSDDASIPAGEVDE